MWLSTNASESRISEIAAFCFSEVARLYEEAYATL